MQDSDLHLLAIVSLSHLLFYNVECLEPQSLIGGVKTDRDEIKYLVSLQVNNYHFCGGSIIEDSFILSAAHCFFNEDDTFDNSIVKVVAGTNNLRSKSAKSIEAYVEKVYVPGNYNNSDWINDLPTGDIAVLKLKQSLNLKNNINIKRLYLPRRRRRYKNHYPSYVGKEVLIAGFGWDKVKIKTSRNKTEYEVGSSTNRLFRANAEVIGNSECQQYYINPLRSNQLCAKVIQHDDDTPQGVCRGDSGGPLVYKSNTIIGVVSGISIGCNENNEPGIYSRVSVYINFIRNALKDVTDNMRIINF